MSVLLSCAMGWLKRRDVVSVICRRSKRLINCPRGSLDGLNMENGRSYFENIVSTPSATSDRRPSNVLRFTDIRTNMVDKTPSSLRLSKAVGTNSSTISLPVKPTSSASELQKEKSTEYYSVEWLERRSREHRRRLRTPEELDEDNVRREEERRRVREAEASATKTSTKNLENIRT